MRWAIALLALLIAVVIPTLIFVGGVNLRGLAWLLVAGIALVLLIDLTDRITDWIQDRRWGRRR
jgi:fatty acid desaturase